MFQINGYDPVKSLKLLDELSKSIPYDKFLGLMKARDLANSCMSNDINPFDEARERLKKSIENLNELEAILKPCLRHKSNSNQ